MRRIIAYLIDCTIIFIVLAPVGLAFQYIFGYQPVSGKEIYFIIVINFSIPVWIYFIYADYSKDGATLGKKFLGIKTNSYESEVVSLKQAGYRTAIKMLPWELTHIASFLLVSIPGQFTSMSWLILSLAYLLIIIYLITAWRSQGKRSIHDHLAITEINLITSNTLR